MAITRLGPSGHGARRASSFAGKTPSGTVVHPVGTITRPGSSGYGVRRTGSFAGKDSSGGGQHPVGLITRPGSSGYGTRRCGSFADKTPDVSIIILPTPAVDHGSAGGGSSTRTGKKRILTGDIRRRSIDIPDHDQEDEEQIVIELLMQVAKMEYFQ